MRWKITRVMNANERQSKTANIKKQTPPYGVCGEREECGVVTENEKIEKNSHLLLLLLLYYGILLLLH